MKIDLQIGGDGLVRGFSHHDGLLTGVEVAAADNAILHIRNVEGDRFVLTLRGVRLLSAVDLWESNCIDRIYFQRVESVDAKEFARLAASRSVEPVHLQRLIEGNASLRIFSLKSSVGAEVFALCVSMDVQQMTNRNPE